MVAINEIRWAVSPIDRDETRILRGKGIGIRRRPGSLSVGRVPRLRQAYIAASSQT
jgi:hypothetical protein